VTEEIRGTFTIIIKQQENGYTIAADGPNGFRVAPKPFPQLEEWLSEEHRETIEWFEKPNHPNLSSERLVELGKQFYKVLFHRSGLGMPFGQAVGYSRDSGIRLCLQVEPPELAKLPWETMYEADMNGGSPWLATRTNMPLIRRLPPASSGPIPRKLKVEGPLRVLFMAASPDSKSLQNLSIEKLAKNLREQLREAEKLEQVKLDIVLNATKNQWRDKLVPDEHHILFFLGHGRENKLCFDDGKGPDKEVEGRMIRQAGDPYWLTAKDLARELEGKKSLRLLFLAACHVSSTQAPATDAQTPLAHQLWEQSTLPAIVAMQSFISKKQAKALTVNFFKALAAFYPVDVALNHARKALVHPNSTVGRDVFTPVLFMRAPDGRLFEFKVAHSAQKETVIVSILKWVERIFSVKPWILALTLLIIVGMLMLGQTFISGNTDNNPATSVMTEEPTPTKTVAILPTATQAPASETPTTQVLATQTPSETPTSETPTTTQAPLPTPTQVPAIPTLKPTSTNNNGMEQVYVPEGEFEMGSANDDPNAEDNEKPRHTVYLDAFSIDRTEVTNAMFARFVQETGHQTNSEKEEFGWVCSPNTNPNCDRANGADWQHPEGPESNLNGLGNHPVVQVSWNDAKAYCEWTGRRLPTEAEWERAGGGPDERKYPWGNNIPTGGVVNFCDQNCAFNNKNSRTNDGYQRTSPVGSYPAGASFYGALDMAGNVWEWVSDSYSPGYYAYSPRENPIGPSGSRKSARGGSWNNNARHIRVRHRSWGDLNSRNDHFGFRCASSP